MKNIAIVVLTIVVIISLGLNYRFYSSQKQSILSNDGFISATVTRIIDGDTIDIDTGERIRLSEINSPEFPTGCLGADAKIRLEELILNKKILYKNLGKDDFGRILGYVFKNYLFINEIMTEEGYAYFAKHKTNTQYSLQIEKAEEKARQTKRGVWSSLCQTNNAGCVIKGNHRTTDNARLYHTPDCYNYNRITIKPGTTDRWFCTESEAKAAGFTKSKDCPK